MARNDEVTQNFERKYHLLIEPRLFPVSQNPDAPSPR